MSDQAGRHEAGGGEGEQEEQEEQEEQNAHEEGRDIEVT